MSSPAIPPLTLDPPDHIHFGDRVTSVGVTVYRAVRAVVGAGGQLSIDSLCQEVWGREVAKRTVWSLCHRVNEKLAELEYPRKFGTSEGNAVLC